MNYGEIVAAAYSYVDREDEDAIAMADGFLRMVESRINRSLRVREMSQRTALLVRDGQDYYGLPSDFGDLVDIELTSADGGTRYPLSRVSQPHFAAIVNDGAPGYWYDLIANQIQIYPATAGMRLEVVYRRKVPELTSTATTNWLADNYPDVYVNGLCVEICAYAKDAEAAKLWDARFVAALREISDSDVRDQWSGPPMQRRILSA